MKLLLTPQQKRLLLELWAEDGTKYYGNLDHMPRDEASKRIDHILKRKERKHRRV